jgi:hypothetical protein
MNKLIVPNRGVVTGTNIPQGPQNACADVQEPNDTSATNAIPYTIEAIAERRVSDEGQEGMKAFLEKRLAAWIVN